MLTTIDVQTNTPPPNIGLGRVLVVDDEAIIRTLAKLMLERSGFTVEEAGTAADAVERVRSSMVPFDAVLVDFTLPDRRGTEVIPDLRQLSPLSRIVLTSGRPEDDMPDHGADGYIAKPFTRDQLTAAIRAALTATNPARP